MYHIMFGIVWACHLWAALPDKPMKLNSCALWQKNDIFAYVTYAAHCLGLSALACWVKGTLTWTSSSSKKDAIRWRPSLVGWRPSLVGRASLCEIRDAPVVGAEASDRWRCILPPMQQKRADVAVFCPSIGSKSARL